MTHEEALGLFSDYFASKLSRESVRAFHAHLNDCEDCKVRLRAMRAQAGAAPFTRLEGDSKKTLEETLRRNRVMVYAVVAVLVCFFFLYRLKP